MLKLKHIVKKYIAGDTTIEALRGIDINFRESEFVSVLGPSGCGKTTLLNIIGGLDRYDEGDLSINGKSTKEFRDSDWDTYRNHSVGFVFQSYNLIPHQTVLSNVELALTLSGVSEAERRKRAIDSLTQVGLADQIHKKPNQMSGGQMQRVAIARALVNNPDILLADEPTGALDTQTSVQIMEILKEISKERLIIMVTHNPDIADRYSTRIIKLLDGNMVGDSHPYDGTEEKKSDSAGKVRKTSMSFITALSLSLNNLMTKKTRTFMTAFAGSIGIIGIALILSLSSGIQTYIDQVQEETLSSYPITIESESVDISSIMSSMIGVSDHTADHELNKIYSSNMMADMMNTMLSIERKENNLKKFKEFIESPESGIDEYISAVRYSYGNALNIFSSDTSSGIYQVNPSTVFNNFRSSAGSSGGGMSSLLFSTSNFNIWEEMLAGKNGEPVNDLIIDQYELLAGRWPAAYNEVVLIIDKNNEINDVYLYSLGLKDSAEISEIMKSAMAGEVYNTNSMTWEYDDLLNHSFKLVLPTDFYQYDSKSGTYINMKDNETYMSYIVNSGVDITICGIIRPDKDAIATVMNGAIGYTYLLTEHVINSVNNSDAVKYQKENPDTDIFLGLPFDDGSEEEISDPEKAEKIKNYFSTLSNIDKAAIYTEIMSAPSDQELQGMLTQYMAMYPDRASKEAVITAAYAEAAGMDEATIKTYLESMSDDDINAAMETMMTEMIYKNYAEQVLSSLGAMTADELAYAFDAMYPNFDEITLASLYDKYMPATVSSSTYDDNISKLGVADLSNPTSISIYTSSFGNKDNVAEIIKSYNNSVDTADQINYTDYIALMMSSISTIINAISYVLIAFVAISLVVSSIMIGIITYISVLERTKEIGILRAIGASKRDISRVFNAETLIVGFISGMLGIIVTIVLCLPINAIIRALSGIKNLTAALPFIGGILLVAISMILTFIAGLIPSRIAAKKDPVEALRTE